MFSSGRSINWNSRALSFPPQISSGAQKARAGAMIREGRPAASTSRACPGRAGGVPRLRTGAKCRRPSRQTHSRRTVGNEMRAQQHAQDQHLTLKKKRKQLPGQHEPPELRARCPAPEQKTTAQAKFHGRCKGRHPRLFSAGGDGNTLLISPFSGEQEQKNHETDFREGVHQRSAKGIVRHQEGRQLPALQ